MSRTFDSFQKSTIKNAAKAVAHFQARKDKLDEQIAALEAQKAELNAQIETYNRAVTDLTGGYTPLELCEKVARGSGGQNDWVFKYPSTIIPPTPESAGTQVAETPENDAEAATMHAPENPVAEQPADTQPENPENNETQEETHEPSDAGGALPEAPAPAEAPRDPMDDIFA